MSRPHALPALILHVRPGANDVPLTTPEKPRGYRIVTEGAAAGIARVRGRDVQAGLGHALLPIAAGLVLAGVANAGPAVMIVAPGTNEILYGPTRIRVDTVRDAARVDIYLDRFSSPICTFVEPPYECEFDAGTRLDSRILRADSFAPFRYWFRQEADTNDLLLVGYFGFDYTILCAMNRN